MLASTAFLAGLFLTGVAAAGDQPANSAGEGTSSRARVTIIDPATMTSPLRNYNDAGSAGAPPVAHYQHDATSEGHSTPASSGMPVTTTTTSTR